MKKKTIYFQRALIPRLNADPEQGLTAQQAKERLEGGWQNGLAQSATKSEKEIIAKNCLTFFNLIFLVLAAILAIGGSSVKNMTFLVIVLCNTVIGIIQEIRAKRAVDKLTLMSAQQLRVIRDGQRITLRSDLLVRDDIVEFVPGNQICADGIVRSGELSVNESLITGEEDAIVKRPGDELRSGSFVVTGMAAVQLTAVGADSFAARLSAEAKANPKATKSEMMRALDGLLKIMGIILIPVGLLLFWQEYKVLELTLRESVEGTVGALVGMIPEGLYLLTSIAMAASALKLTQDRVLVQDMNCIESLARVDVLCVDKTGTITEAVMQVENVIPLTDDPPEKLETILKSFYSGVEPENDTARAMAQAFAGDGGWAATQRIPFTSATKWSACSFEQGDTYVIGAPEFTMAGRYWQLQQQVEEHSALGYRVLLVAQYAAPAAEKLNENLLTPLALVLLSNRIRPEAPETFAYFAKQGVSVKVISGDNPLTVSEVARRANIPGAENWVDASVLETDEDFTHAALTCTVFGRVTPDKKKRLIATFKALGHTVAMTGDGVNDVLAMKESDCSIAMAGGAQAASQIGKLVLLDANFAAMPSIVDEGRRVINNIQRSATLFLVKNIFSLGLALLTFLTGFAYPFAPLHLTVISTMTIGVPGFLLALEPNYRRIKDGFLKTVLRKALPCGLTDVLLVVLAQVLCNLAGFMPNQISTICTALLALVGMLVLLETCKPLNLYRGGICALMTLGIVGCFTLLVPLFDFAAGGWEFWTIGIGLGVAAPFVLWGLQKLFDLGEAYFRQLMAKKRT